MVSELEGHLIEDGNLLSSEAVAGEPIGRQDQVKGLRTCLAPMLRGEPALNTWVCGPPGSGKTLLARWATQKICGGAGSRVAAYVNCWEHRSLYSVLQAIIDELKILGAEAQDTSIKMGRIRQALRGRPFAVILDEIDRPMPAQQEEIVYGLLGLPKGALACIANGTQALATMDERVRSRLSPVVVELTAYSTKEIEAILTDRARRSLVPGSWSSAVLRRIAAGAAGDARLAIQLLRQGAAAAEEAGSSRIDWRFVEQRIRQYQALREESRLAGLSEHERIIWELVLQHTPLGTAELARHYISHCQRHGIQPMARRTFTKYLSRLAATGMVAVSQQPLNAGGRVVCAQGPKKLRPKLRPEMP
jgi:cell division control protein 6